MRPAAPERGATPGREPSCNCCSKTPDAADGTLEVPSHYPLDTRAEFRALYPAQAVLGDWWLGKGRTALVKRRPVPRGALRAPPTVQTEISLSPEEQSAERDPHPR